MNQSVVKMIQLVATVQMDNIHLLTRNKFSAVNAFSEDYNLHKCKNNGLAIYEYMPH